MRRFKLVSAALASAGLVATAGAAAAADTTESRGSWHHSCEAEKNVVRSVPLRIPPAWKANDATAFAAVFSDDPSFIIPGQDTYLRSREEIRDYMAALFAGPIKGSRVTARVLSLRCVSRDVGIVVTEGGMLLGSETEVPLERVGRQTWTIVRHRGDWAVAAYHNSRITPGF